MSFRDWFSRPVKRGLEAYSSQLHNDVSATSNTQTGGFLMDVDDVFSIPGKGSGITGRIAMGSIFVGDAIVILRRDDVLAHTHVVGIEAFTKPLLSADAGQRVGLLVSGVDIRYIYSGDYVVKECDLHGD